MKTFIPVAFSLGVLLLSSVARGQQEEPPKVRDLTDTEVTSADLIDALNPATEPPRTRGGEIPSGPAKCTFFRKQITRGLSIKPAADPVALTVLFELNSAEISPSAKKTLDALGEALLSARLTPCCFQLEGHTDNWGTDDYNRALSRRRAESVARYLSQRSGIAMERLLPVGYGESRPIASNDSDTGRQKNRRVQVVNLGYGTVEQ